MKKLKLKMYDASLKDGELKISSYLSEDKTSGMEIGMPLRQARVLSKWLQKELKTKNKKK